MPKVIYQEHDGNKIETNVRVGESLMQGAVNEGLDSIVAECGGNCVCATCHCYIQEEFVDKLNAMDEYEDDMLDSVACERKPNSRLSCQITMSDALDGITVHIPESQY